ncbi:MAG TPA: hypothetical protein VMW55_08635 [Nitrosopumilaceae archaeon]|jgi:hypothetical protein|nr:hypothetical protein [Nitrosopumilaceae archaeon]
MKKQLIGAIASILVLTIIFSSIQSTDAQYYSGHDGSVDEYLEKVVVKPYGAKKDYWTYIVKACATKHHIAVAEVILKSDIDKKVLGVNKSIIKGNCVSYGAVMKAKDGKTLGAELVEKHEAVEKMVQILKDSQDASKLQRKNMMKEFMRLYTTIGLMPRI